MPDRIVKPRLYSIDEIEELPKDKPYGIYDLDGTLTEPGAELLMAAFVRQVKIGKRSVREELKSCFKEYKAAHEDRKKKNAGSPKKIAYEDYLTKIGVLWAEMLAKLPRAEVMEASEKWYKAEGYKEVLPYAPKMMAALEKYRFNRMMITGAPAEIAHPFAAHIGIEHVFAMMAEVDADGRYTGKMRTRHNTGLLSNKGVICDGVSQECAVGVGAGDTMSDTVIQETAFNCRQDNPIDIKGVGFLLNPSSGVIEQKHSSAQHHIDAGRLIIVPKTSTPENTMRIFRASLREILLTNGMVDQLREIEGVRPI